MERDIALGLQPDCSYDDLFMMLPELSGQTAALQEQTRPVTGVDICTSRALVAARKEHPGNVPEGCLGAFVCQYSGTNLEAGQTCHSVLVSSAETLRRVTPERRCLTTRDKPTANPSVSGQTAA